MDASRIMAKDRLGFFGILGEALRISAASPRFLILASLASFPLFCSLLLNEFLLQQTLLNAAHFAFDGMSECSTSGGVTLCTVVGPVAVLRKWVGEASQGLVLMGALYLVIVSPLDLVNTIVLVHNASAIYGGENLPNLRGFFVRPLKQIGFRGPLVTSMLALVLCCLTLVGLVSLASNIYVLSSSFLVVEFSSVLPIIFFAALFVKYMEWSAVWNTGIVISILEEKHGDIALGVAAHLSRGSRRKGLALVLMLFIWRLALRLSCLYLARYRKESGFVATIVQVYLVCLGNVVKWSVFMVYYCGCKKRFLEKKIDVEEGEAAPLVKS
ncbi:uncharacterized protein LOC115757512 [Rhodamnia argentea]|uniref:Uncharacterized protein LOC115757512 n=1 Tax=Rhodamnia argentea TaxID=178133 RepID=A0A8B8R2C8_9MYRT|nr:uncharacterized protein LOC115757512 [Rhodamnia argentea]